MRIQDARTTILNLLAAVGRAPRDTLLRATSGDEAMLDQLIGDLVAEGLAALDGDALRHCGPAFSPERVDGATSHDRDGTSSGAPPVLIACAAQDGRAYGSRLSQALEWSLGRGACRVLLETDAGPERAEAVRHCRALLLVPTEGWWLGACGRDVALAVYLGRPVIAVRVQDEPAPLAHPLLEGVPQADPVGDADELAAYLRGSAGALPAPQRRPVLGVEPLSFAHVIARHSVEAVARPGLQQSFETWLSWEDQCLAFVGEAGVGKTAFCAALAVSQPRRVVAAHLATPLHAATLDPLAYVATLVTHLHRQLPGYAEALGDRRTDLPREPVAGLRDLVLAPLQAMETPSEPVVLLTDGADNEGLLDLLAVLVDGLPSWAKLLVTGRSDTGIVARLKDVAVEPIETASPTQRQDVMAYVGARATETEVNAPVTAIAHLCGGSFLAASLLLAALRCGALEAEELGSLAPGLDGVLGGVLAQQFDETDGLAQAHASALSALLVAQEPMPLGVLAMSVGCPESELTSLLAPVSWLLSESWNDGERCYSLAAEAVAGWLSDSGRAGRYFLEAAQGHLRIADALAGRWDERPYALRNLPSHLLALDDLDCAARLLTDMAFIEARCRSGMAPRLVSELARVAEGLRGQDAEEEKRLLRDEAAREYAIGLAQYAERSTWWYASHWSRRARARLLGRGRPEPSPLNVIPSARPWTDEDIYRETARVAAQPTLSERVAAVREWLQAEGRHLVIHGHEPGYCVQQAYASAADGPVARMAGEALTSRQSTVRLAAVSRDRPPFEWRPACRAVLTGHPGAVHGVAVSADGRLAASVGDDNVLRLWDVGTGRCLRQVDETVRGARCVSLTADGQIVAYGRANGAVRVLEVATGRPLCTLSSSPWHIQTLDLTPDARLVVCAGAHGIVHVWDVDRERHLRALSGHSSSVNGVAIAADGATVLTAGDDRTVCVWDVAKGTCVHVLQGMPREVKALSVTPQASLALAGGGDGVLWLWDTASGRCVGEMGEGDEAIRAVSLSADGQLAAAGGDDCLLRVYDARTGRCVRELSGHTGPVRSVAMTPDGRTAVTGAEDGTVRVWDVTRGQSRPQEVNAPTALSRHGHIEPLHTVLRPVRTWAGSPGADLSDLQEHRAYAEAPDGKISVSGRRDRRLRVFELATGHCRHVLRGHAAPITGVSLSPDGRWAASSADLLRLWDIERGARIRVLPKSENVSRAVAVSPDGRLIAGCGDGVCLWDARSGAVLTTLSGAPEGSEVIAFSANGRLVVAGGADGTVVVWRLPSVAPVQVLRGSRSYISSAALGDHGDVVVAGDGEAVLRLWDVAGGQTLSVVRLMAPAFGLRIRWNVVIATDSLGGVHSFNVHGLPDSLPAATAVRRWCFGDDGAPGDWEEQRRVSCPWCKSRFEPTDRALTALAGFRTAVGDLVPSMALPAAAWEDPRLRQTCPHCELPLRLVPFCVDDSDLPLPSHCFGAPGSAVHDSPEAEEAGDESAQDGCGQACAVDAEDGHQQSAGEHRSQRGPAEVGGVEPGSGPVLIGLPLAPNAESTRRQRELEADDEADDGSQQSEGQVPDPPPTGAVLPQ